MHKMNEWICCVQAEKKNNQSAEEQNETTNKIEGKTNWIVLKAVARNEWKTKITFKYARHRSLLLWTEFRAYVNAVATSENTMLVPDSSN